MKNTTIAQEYAFFSDLCEICSNVKESSSEIDSVTESLNKAIDDNLALIDLVMVSKRAWFLHYIWCLSTSSVGDSYEVYALIQKAKETFTFLSKTCEYLEGEDFINLFESTEDLRQEIIRYHALCESGPVNSKMVFSYLENECYHLLVKISPYLVTWWKDDRSIQLSAQKLDPKSVTAYNTLTELDFI